MTAEAETRALATRLWLACLATQELMTVYLGMKLNLYDHLSRGPATVVEFAERAGIAPRYAREWLEQQAVAGILRLNRAAAASEPVYSLPLEHREVLISSDGALSVAGAAALPLGGVARAMPMLLEAFRSGDGVPDAVYGTDWRDGHVAANRALFAHHLLPVIQKFVPEVHARLRAGGSRIADIACGAGWSSIALARGYADAQVDGFDLDPGVVEIARRNAADRGLAGRVTFEMKDAGAPGAWVNARRSYYDLVCIFDALHEMPRPVDVLRCCREIRAPGGCVLIMDAKVLDTLTAPADEIERFQYATSVLHCLPASLTGHRPAGTGTVMRSSLVREYALAAGFAHVDVTAVNDRFHRIYHLTG